MRHTMRRSTRLRESIEIDRSIYGALSDLLVNLRGNHRRAIESIASANSKPRGMAFVCQHKATSCQFARRDYKKKKS